MQNYVRNDVPTGHTLLTNRTQQQFLLLLLLIHVSTYIQTHFVTSGHHCLQTHFTFYIALYRRTDQSHFCSKSNAIFVVNISDITPIFYFFCCQQNRERYGRLPTVVLLICNNYRKIRTEEPLPIWQGLLCQIVRVYDPLNNCKCTLHRKV